MKRKAFTDTQRKELQQNPNVHKVTNCNVEFTDEFKRTVLQESAAGKGVRGIFAEHGIPDWLNVPDYAKDTTQRWRKASNRPSDAVRKRGRPCKPPLVPDKPLTELTQAELIKKIQLLELEVEFLKKLEPLAQ